MNLREWALPVYTILMQLATGAMFVLWVIRRVHLKRLGSASMDRILRRPVLVIFITLLVAIFGAHFHLSNPIQSVLAILNIRHSWLSREILFTILMLLSVAALLDRLWSPVPEQAWVQPVLGWAAVISGCAAIYSMASIYLLPTQVSWNHWSTILVFFGSSLLVGITSATALLVMDAVFSRRSEPDLAADRLSILQRSLGWLVGLAGAAMLMVLVLNTVQILGTDRSSELSQTSLSLLLGLYRPLFGLRFIILAAGVGIYSFAAYQVLMTNKELSELVIPVYMACLLALIAEILGRFLFYASHVRLGI